MTPDERQVEREIWIALERLVTRMENFFAARTAAQKYRADQLRWPAGSPGSIGGQFAPANGGTAYGNYLRTGRRPVQLAMAGSEAQFLVGAPATSQFGEPPTADTDCEDYDTYYPPSGVPRHDEPPCSRRKTDAVVQHWSDFRNAVTALPDISVNERFYYMEFFATEGGLRADTSEGLAVAGITQGTLANARKQTTLFPDLANVTDPRQLTDGQRVRIYRWLIDDALRWAVPGGKDGHTELSRISSPYTAAAIADPLLRYPGPDGASMVQQAVIDVISGLPEDVRQRHAEIFAKQTDDGKLGSNTMNAIVILEQEGYGPYLREGIADRREARNRRAIAVAEDRRRRGLRVRPVARETNRNDHFRFRGKL